MKIINYEAYVSPEVAKLLKKAGFNWECKTCYIGKSIRLYKYYKFFNWNIPRRYFENDGSDNLFHAFITQKKNNSFISAPTLDVAQRWLREVKGYNVLVCHDFKLNKHGWWILKDNIMLCHNYGTQFDIYEEAQEAGIKEALELILEKGE